MKYKALISFSGIVTMAMDEVMEISDENIAKDLLRANFIEPVVEEKKDVEKKGVEKKSTPSKSKTKKSK